MLWFACGTKLSSQPEATARKAARIGLLWGLLSGVFSYSGLQLYAVALETGKANLVAPIFSTYGLVVVIGAVLWLKEKLTVLQGIAIVMLFIGLFLLRG